MKIVLFICFPLFILYACNSDAECEITGICASGKWQVSGFGELKNCKKKEYNTNSFYLSSPSFEVMEKGATLLSGYSTWSTGSSNSDSLSFYLEEKLEMGTLKLSFSGVYIKDEYDEYDEGVVDSIVVSGDFDVTGDCQGSGFFTVDLQFAHPANVVCTYPSFW